ncbi:MAG: hypothetical protein ACREOZ_04325, partial [Gloeomargaritales cyanobacterium]
MSTTNDRAHIQEIGRHLKALALEQYEEASNPPEELYTEYLPFAGLLPEDASTWGFNITSLYWDALTDRLQMALTQVNIDPPNPNTMATKGAQMAALRLLRTAAVRQASALRAQYNDFRHILYEISNNKNQSSKYHATPKQRPQNFTTTIANEDYSTADDPTTAVYRHSVAEQVIQQYTQPPHDRQRAYPISPDDGKPSDYP